jgi:ABC-type Fe3+ transport system permease subunit
VKIVVKIQSMRKLNWPIWLGFAICVFAFLSYPLLFVNWESTRDFPWANLVLFAIAELFIVIGVRRAFQPGRRTLSKVVAGIIAMLSGLVLVMFIFVAFVAARWLPPSTNAPQVAQKAPDFTLNDTSNKPTSLAELLSQPINGKPARGVLLVFYRGYW